MSILKENGAFKKNIILIRLPSLTIKAPITTAPDDNSLKKKNPEKQVSTFQVNCLLGDESHEMSRFIFSEK